MRHPAARLFFFCLFLWGAMFPGLAHAQSCATAQAKRSFLQLWLAHAEYSPAQWDALFQGLAHHGFSEIIVQWSSYGPVSFFSDTRPGRKPAECLPALIAAARRAKCKLWIGLHYDPEFWRHIEKESGLVSYLESRDKFFISSLPLLLNLVQTTDPAGDTVAGWYIADEIDDLNWQSLARQTALLKYLDAVSSRLHAAAPQFPILISGFVNGRMAPAEWSTLVKRILTDTAVQVFLLQDAIGTGKMTVERLQPYLQAMQQSLPNPASRFTIVVEIFSMAADSEENTQAGPFARIVEQLKAAALTSRLPLTVFSAPDHLLDYRRPGSQTLSQQWLNDRTGCHDEEGNKTGLFQGILLLLEETPRPEK